MATELSALTPTPNTDIRHEAAGNLAFLLSVIRCGESLSEAEESNVRRVIEGLGVTPVPPGMDIMPQVQPPSSAMMPRWKCHKEVFAIKIVDILPHDGATDAGFAATLVGDDGKHYHCTSEYMGKHKPQEGGYLVEYDDGYRSWSPCKAFEEGYTRIS